MDLFTTAPTNIKVKDGLDRYRKDMGDVESLAKSIKLTRQILPIVVTRDMELIDGGRRLAACILLGKEVKCVYEDVVNELEMRELELEANCHRKDYTPAEEALAIRDLHTLKQSKFGEAKHGPGESGHSTRDTAKLLGKSQSTVMNAIEMAAMVEAFPELAQAKTKRQIKDAAKGLQKLAGAISSQGKLEQAIKEKADLFKIVKMRAEDHMALQTSKSINILCTDPPYGIEATTLTMNLGKDTGGTLSTSGFQLQDPTEKGLEYYALLAKESFRFTTDDAHGWVFMAPEHFHKIREIFVKAGWRAHIKPVIWIKGTSGQCNVTHAWPSSCYEMLLYIRKDQSRLVQEGQPDWIQCPTVSKSERLHQWQKPVPLLETLLARVALPGQTVYDPFMGAGSTLEAAAKLNLFSIGCDNADECYAYTLQRLSKIGVKDEREN
jgi:ParB/RepB/Spo0J family partition protein